jgi:hypothetical protein
MKKVTIIVGAPGAGKTALAKQLIAGRKSVEAKSFIGGALLFKEYDVVLFEDVKAENTQAIKNLIEEPTHTADLIFTSEENIQDGLAQFIAECTTPIHVIQLHTFRGEQKIRNQFRFSEGEFGFYVIGTEVMDDGEKKVLSRAGFQGPALPVVELMEDVFQERPQMRKIFKTALICSELHGLMPKTNTADTADNSGKDDTSKAS